MKIFDNPPESTWPELTRRPQLELGFLESAVRNIITRVRQSGDTALRELTLQHDRIAISAVRVTRPEIEEATKKLPDALKAAIQQAAANIEKFHAAQQRHPERITTTPGVTCWRKAVPIGKVGMYVPGGSAPLFSTVLMLGIPARIAGCREIVLCTPPDNEGKVNPAILFAAQLVGITGIFKTGGAQAIAAMTFGTESIPAVYKIFGPGNQYVTKAKQIVTEFGVAIDMPAGPSEVLIMADESATPEFVAADLLSQAEHGEDSQVMLVANSHSVVSAVVNEVGKQLDSLPRKQIAEKALANSSAVIIKDPDDALRFVNRYAPEHLIINIKEPASVVDRIENAGSVFLGNYSPEAIGDYASGTNHTLPTNGYARAYAGVSLESFFKYITFQELTPDGIRNLGPAVETMAEAERLIGHKMAVRLRLNRLETP